jgi:hypothetical protein
LSVLLRSSLLCLLGISSVFAGELAPYREGSRLGAHVRNVQFPATFRKDLRSGLTNRLLFRVDLLTDSRIVDSRTVELAVKYDLWDENYRLTVAVGQNLVSNTMLSEEGMIAFLGNLRLPAMFETARLASAREHVLRGEVLVNPIERERMAMIRKWVAENSTQVPRGTAGAGEAGAPLGAVTSGDLFNRIFGQYAGSADGGVGWRENLEPRGFRLEAVPNEGQ